MVGEKQMRKLSALRKVIFREITSTKARFFSILILILLGVGFFSGLQAVGPNMLSTLNHYFNQQNVYDIHVQSNYGLDEEELNMLTDYEAIREVSPRYRMDVLAGEDRLVMNVMGTDSDPSMNQFVIQEGRLPNSTTEIALDYNEAMTSRYRIGDTISIASGSSSESISDNFNEDTFEVVGFVTTPLFITNDSRGQSLIGRGRVDAFGVVHEDVFNMDVHTDVYLSFNSLRELAMYSDDYKEAVSQYKVDIEPLLEAVGRDRIDQIRESIEEELVEAENDINQALDELSDAEATLEEAREEIEAGQVELAEGEAELEEARLELVAGEREYEEGRATLEREIAEAEAELDQQENELRSNQEEVEAGLSQVRSGLNSIQEPYIELVETETMLLNERDEIRQLSSQLDELFQVPIEMITDENRQAWIDETEDVMLGEVALTDLLIGYFNEEVEATVISSAVNEVEQELDMALAEVRGNLEAINEERQALEVQESELEANLEAITNGLTEIESGRETLAENEATGRAELSEAREELSEGWYAYDQGLEEIEESRATLSEAQLEYDEGIETFEIEREEAMLEIEEAEQEISEAREELSTLESPTYYINSRHDQSQIAEYGDNANRMSELATIFPVVFFLIAALVTLTTVTRMIEEQRTEIGTLKALGYSDRDIQKKYYIYSLSASTIGAILGLAIGYTLLPNIIFNAYRILYDLPNLSLAFYWSFTMISFVIAILSTLIASWYVLKNDLKSTPAILMRPKPPKSGQRIFLERFTPMWKRMNFMQKVTARNLFRYKQRMLMTVVGISGCAALIITGFGLESAVQGIVDLQFGRVMQYDAVVALDDDASVLAQERYREVIDAEAHIDDALVVYQEAFEVSETGVTTQDVTVFVPETAERLNDFVQLRNRRTEETYMLTDEGVLVTEKIAELFDLEIGDEVNLTTPDNEQYAINVTGVVENYAGHYIYMSEAVYQDYIEPGAIPFNAELLVYEVSDAFESDLAAELSDLDYVITISFNEGMVDTFRDSMESLNIVVFVLIVAAAGLAFVVLYNLTNINVSERIRELSTIKVLGFYDHEVTLYIYRENIILTLMGIAVGAIFGRFLHYFVLDTASMDNMMFNPELPLSSYLYAAVLTLVFSTFVMWIMHLKLRKVDMIEALKSNE